MSTVALAQDLGIETSGDLKQQLTPYVSQGGPLRVDASQIGRVHTASIQLLCAFVKARRQAGHATTFHNSTDVFRDAVRLLGVLQELNLEAAPDKSNSVENVV